jgi:hypothetical protein
MKGKWLRLISKYFPIISDRSVSENPEIGKSDEIIRVFGRCKKEEWFYLFGKCLIRNVFGVNIQ